MSNEKRRIKHHQWIAQGKAQLTLKSILGAILPKIWTKWVENGKWWHCCTRRRRRTGSKGGNVVVGNAGKKKRKQGKQGKAPFAGASQVT